MHGVPEWFEYLLWPIAALAWIIDNPLFVAAALALLFVGAYLLWRK